VPQDIPVEASETLAFVPECLREIEGAPSFVLRAPTSREKRFRRRLLAEEGAAYHSDADMRAEILNALKSTLWGEEKFATHGHVLTAYWEALDDFEQQRNDSPDLKWSYAADEEAAVTKLLRDVEQAWPQVGRMKADNLDFNDIFLAATVAVVVEDWTGIDVPKALDRKYLTIECVDQMGVRLMKFAEQNKILGRLAWMQLANACSNRMSLDEEEEKNSESPSPSEMTPPVSSETVTLGKGGKSPASARSKKTPVAA